MLFAELARSMSRHNAMIHDNKQFDNCIERLDNIIHYAIENGRTYTRIEVDAFPGVNMQAVQDYLRNFGYNVRIDKEGLPPRQYLDINWER